MLLGSISFCYKTAAIWKIVGNVVLILKIVIPIILIILAIVDFGKQVVSYDEKNFKEAIVRILKKFVAAALIFFLPGLLTALFSLYADFANVKSDYKKCVDCITNPNSKCDTSYRGGIFPTE